jgi:murein DD-endopeptidase MepM/ murein hydrolase activator NlpD
MASHAFSRNLRPPRDLVRRLLLAVVIPAGGCSADVTRFNYPALGVTDNGASRTTGALPTPSEPVWQRGAGSGAGLTPPPRGAGLSDAPGEDRAAARPPAEPDQRGQPIVERAPAPLPSPREGERQRIAASGETIEVQRGETLYSIARRYGVSIGALIELNGLGDGTALKPGQRLALPAGAGHAQSVVSQPEGPPGRTTERPPSGWERQHRLQVGESLYGVARQYRVDVAELQRVNGIAEPGKVRAGTMLRVPSGAEPAAVPEVGLPHGTPGEPHSIAPQPGTGQGEVRTARLNNTADDASPPLAAAPAAEGHGKFRWPARGRVIAGFGARPDGTRNDGINIAVPLGTEIHAAEAGRVAYAGSELKGYGNLVLLRHDNGWVSAYAHAEEILVKRDDVVRRGQVIGRAGKTGSVDQPQLHFELRQGAKPVDPLPHLEP